MPVLPPSLPPQPQHVIFVIDASASMLREFPQPSMASISAMAKNRTGSALQMMFAYLHTLMTYCDLAIDGDSSDTIFVSVFSFGGSVCPLVSRAKIQSVDDIMSVLSTSASEIQQTEGSDLYTALVQAHLTVRADSKNSVKPTIVVLSDGESSKKSSSQNAQSFCSKMLEKHGDLTLHLVNFSSLFEPNHLFYRVRDDSVHRVTVIHAHENNTLFRTFNDLSQAVLSSVPSLSRQDRDVLGIAKEYSSILRSLNLDAGEDPDWVKRIETFLRKASNEPREHEIVSHLLSLGSPLFFQSRAKRGSRLDERHGPEAVDSVFLAAATIRRIARSMGRPRFHPAIRS